MKRWFQRSKLLPLVSFFLASLLYAEEAQTSLSNIQASASTHAIFSNEQVEEGSAEKNNVLMHEARLQVEGYGFFSGIQFTNRYAPDHLRQGTRAFQLEKKWLSYEFSSGKATLGDSHLELGKGIALALYRDPVFGIDTTVEGGVVKIDQDSFGLLAFGGRLNSWKAPVAVFAVTDPLKDREVYLGGGQGKLKTSLGDAGAHYFLAVNRPKTGPSDQRWHTVGTSLSTDKIWEGGDVYLESNFLRQEPLVRTIAQLPTGFGTYGAVTHSDSPWLLKLEGKDYRQYSFEFRRPPTLEEDFIESQNIVDVSAGRLSAEYRFPSVRLQSSYLFGEDRVVKSLIHHGVLGAKWDGFAKTKWESKVGYRALPYHSNLAHAGIKVKVPTFASQNLELGGRKFRETKDLDSQARVEDRNIIDLGYSFGNSVTLGVGYEYFPQDPNN